MPPSSYRSVAAAVAGLAILITPAATASPPGRPGAVVDVALDQGGLLRGVVVNAAGAPIPDAPVSLHSGGCEILRAATNSRGEFSVAALKGGVYEIVAAEHHGVYRLWSPGTEPPSANRGILAVSGDVMRAQFAPPPEPLPQPVPGYVQPVPYTPGGSGPMGKGVQWVKQHPWITAGAVATAIAVPVAVSEFDDDPAS